MRLTDMTTSPRIGCLLGAEAISPFENLMNLQRRLLARLAGRLRNASGEDEASDVRPVCVEAPSLTEVHQIDHALRRWVSLQESSAVSR